MAEFSGQTDPIGSQNRRESTEIAVLQQELHRAYEYAKDLEEIIRINKEALRIATTLKSDATELKSPLIAESNPNVDNVNCETIQNLQLLVGQLQEENKKLLEMVEKTHKDKIIEQKKVLTSEKSEGFQRHEPKLFQAPLSFNRQEAKEGERNVALTAPVMLPFEDLLNSLGSWKEPLRNAWSSPTFLKLTTFLSAQYSTQKIYPPFNLIFNAFNLTPIEKVRVVIIGQEPYNQPGQAMGLSFSVPKGIKIPASLLNVYRSLETDKELSKKFITPKHGDLTQWANQGVLLLGSVLTVQDSIPNSHKAAGWVDFTDEVLKVINKECDKVVFLLWGGDAQKKAAGIDTDKHLVLKTSHPSGLSFSQGFSTAYHFSKCNDYLKKNSFSEIDWNLD